MNALVVEQVPNHLRVKTCVFEVLMVEVDQIGLKNQVIVIKRFGASSLDQHLFCLPAHSNRQFWSLYLIYLEFITHCAVSSIFAIVVHPRLILHKLGEHLLCFLVNDVDILGDLYYVLLVQQK